MPNSISVILPKFGSYQQQIKGSTFNKVNERTKALNDNELKIYNYLKKNPSVDRKEVEKLLNLKKTQTAQILSNLVENGILIRIGKGRDIAYTLLNVKNRK